MSTTQKEIQKVTLLKVKDGYGLKVKFKEIDVAGAPASDDKESKGLIHPDLKAAMDAMSIHWGLLSGLIKIGEVPDIAMAEHPLLEKIHVNGVSIGGEDETAGIILSGHYQTWRNKAQQLNTPFERFEGQPESLYVYMDDLKAKLRNIESETQKFLSGEKRGTKPAPAEDPNQTKLDFVAGEDGTKKAEAKKQAGGSKGKKKEEKKIEGPKVTEEGNLAPASAKHKFADKDAMARVAEIPADGATPVVEEQEEED